MVSVNTIDFKIVFMVNGKAQSIANFSFIILNFIFTFFFQIKIKKNFWLVKNRSRWPITNFSKIKYENLSFSPKMSSQRPPDSVSLILSRQGES